MLIQLPHKLANVMVKRCYDARHHIHLTRAMLLHIANRRMLTPTEVSLYELCNSALH